MILDTTVLVDLLRNEKNAVKKIKELEENNEALSTTTISVFEIMQGIPKNASLEKTEKVGKLFESITILRFDYDSAVIAGDIQRGLRISGKLIDPEDAMIAGIAKIHNEPVLTRNTKHFERIPDMKIKSY